MYLNKRLILKVMSSVLVVVSIALLLPWLVALYYKEAAAAKAFIVCAVPLLVIALLLYKYIPKANAENLNSRDGFFIVGASWVLMSALGAFPFVISGEIPNYIDAFFETASGFSTTGSTILTDVEVLSKSILFWRSLTHWLGGMGVLVLAIALIPKLGIGGQKMMRAETTGPTMDKSNFTFAQSARTSYLIYIGMTIVMFILLLLGDIGPFDSIIHVLGTMGTGGYSNYNASVSGLNSCYAEMVIAIFMLLCGINFGIYALIVNGKVKTAIKDVELRVYLAVIAISTAFIAFMLLINNFYGSILESLRYAFFQVCSIITTSGFATADFDLWPTACKFIIVLLMLSGACASSTGGGIKIIRFVLWAKMIVAGMKKRLHPNAIIHVKLGGKVVPESVLFDLSGFLGLYAFIIGISTFLISLENVDLVTAFTAVVAAVSNIGPGLSMVGPVCNFAFFSGASKLLLSFLMIAGRLELYTIILLFTPRFWGRKS